MLTALSILGVLVVLFLVAALATRESQALAPAPPDAADLALTTPATAESVRGLRFGLAVRGYRMSEVDAALDRLAGDLEERDRRIAELSGSAGGAAPATTVEPVATTPVAPAPVPRPVVETPEPVAAPTTDAAFGGVAPPADAPAPAVDPAPVAARSGSITFDDFPAVQPADDDAALDAGHAGAAAAAAPVLPADADVVAPVLPADADLPSGPAAAPREAPPAEVGQAPVEPVDPPPLRTP